MGKRRVMRGFGRGAVLLTVLAGGVCGWAETCTTQSQMQAGDRDGLAAAARALAASMQAGQVSAVQAETVPELQADFAGVRQALTELEPELKGDTFAVEAVYLLDASKLAAGADAQFFCSLNRSQAEVDFSIRGLTAGVYGFAVVRGVGSSPWRVSMLLRRSGARWLLAGFFPGPTEAAGHDGVWYWKEARRLAAAKQAWNAWLLYGEARTLLLPAPFVQSTNLEKLDDERKSAAPPALSAGISDGTPLVVKAADGKEFRVTALGTDAIAGRSKVDVVVRVDAAAADPATLRAESDAAAKAVVAAYPELRGEFGGVVTTLVPASGQPLTTERAMGDVH